MFGEIAGRYDFLNHLLSMNVDRYWRWKTVRRVAPQGTDPILDVCTGTGDLAFAYLRRVPPGTEVVGTDFCREMLHQGYLKQPRKGGAGKVTFLEADTQHLPFDDDLFQIDAQRRGSRWIKPVVTIHDHHRTTLQCGLPRSQDRQGSRTATRRVR